MPTFEEAEDDIFTSVFSQDVQKGITKPFPGQLVHMLDRLAREHAARLRPLGDTVAVTWASALNMSQRETAYAVVHLTLTAVHLHQEKLALPLRYAPGDKALVVGAIVAAIPPPPTTSPASLSMLWDSVAETTTTTLGSTTPYCFEALTQAETQQRRYTVRLANSYALLAEWLQQQQARCSNRNTIVMPGPLDQAQRLAKLCATGNTTDLATIDTWRMRLGLPRS
jgi:hypothetical protein